MHLHKYIKVIAENSTDQWRTVIIFMCYHMLLPRPIIVFVISVRKIFPIALNKFASELTILKAA